MSVIAADKLCKSFRIAQRRPGVRGIVQNFVNRQYQQVSAIRDVTLSIAKGELVGLIGENGAGKTTLVKILTGIIPATSGEARLFGRGCFELRDAEKRRLSLVMGQRSQLWWDVPALDSFELLRAIYDIPAAAYRERLDFYSSRLDVRNCLGTQLRKLSLGQRMKMEIIGAFLHDPEMVFLDEPTLGLDLISRETIRDFLVTVNREQSVTVLLTSHDMEDIERTCQRIVILDQGSTLFDGDRLTLSRKLNKTRSVVVQLESDAAGWSEEHALRAKELGAKLHQQSSGQLGFLVDADHVQPFARFLMDGFAVRDLSIEREPLEHLIKEIFTTGVVERTGRVLSDD